MPGEPATDAARCHCACNRPCPSANARRGTRTPPLDLRATGGRAAGHHDAPWCSPDEAPRDDAQPTAARPMVASTARCAPPGPNASARSWRIPAPGLDAAIPSRAGSPSVSAGSSRHPRRDVERRVDTRRQRWSRPRAYSRHRGLLLPHGRSPDSVVHLSGAARGGGRRKHLRTIQQVRRLHQIQRAAVEHLGAERRVAKARSDGRHHAIR